MDDQKIKQLIEKVLNADERLWNEDKTELNQTLLLDLVDKIDEKIIDLLLQENETREKFFVKIKDVYVFKTNDFKFFMEENKVDNSYTQYKKRMFLSMLDLNQMYVQKTEMADKKFGINEKDQKLTLKFYNMGA